MERSIPPFVIEQHPFACSELTGDHMDAVNPDVQQTTAVEFPGTLFPFDRINHLIPCWSFKARMSIKPPLRMP